MIRNFLFMILFKAFYKSLSTLRITNTEKLSNHIINNSLLENNQGVMILRIKLGKIT